MKDEELGHLEVQENNTMITFGRKLKHLRQKNHLTQKELGMAMGFPEDSADVRKRCPNTKRGPYETLFSYSGSPGRCLHCTSTLRPQRV